MNHSLCPQQCPSQSVLYLSVLVNITTVNALAHNYTARRPAGTRHCQSPLILLQLIWQVTDLVELWSIRAQLLPAFERIMKTVTYLGPRRTCKSECVFCEMCIIQTGLHLWEVNSPGTKHHSVPQMLTGQLLCGQISTLDQLILWIFPIFITTEPWLFFNVNLFWGKDKSKNAAKQRCVV